MSFNLGDSFSILSGYKLFDFKNFTHLRTPCVNESNYLEHMLYELLILQNLIVIITLYTKWRFRKFPVYIIWTRCFVYWIMILKGFDEVFHKGVIICFSKCCLFCIHPLKFRRKKNPPSTLEDQALIAW